jgi:uncharacterized SAM-binding protein YcdF (DUF218 family)
MSRRLQLIGVLAGLLGVAVLSGFVAFANMVVRYQAKEPSAADGIVVLTGGQMRVAEGMRLLAEGKAPRMLISGVNPHTTADQLWRAQHVQAPRLLECCIDIGRDAHDTIGNAAEAAAWATRRRMASLILVTASYHLPRSLVEFERALPGVRLVPHAVPLRHLHMEAWWAYPGTAYLLAGEYVKYLLASVRRHVVVGVG